MTRKSPLGTYPCLIWHGRFYPKNGQLCKNGKNGKMGVPESSTTQLIKMHHFSKNHHFCTKTENHQKPWNPRNRGFSGFRGSKSGVSRVPNRVPIQSCATRASPAHVKRTYSWYITHHMHNAQRCTTCAHPDAPPAQPQWTMCPLWDHFAPGLRNRATCETISSKNDFIKIMKKIFIKKIFIKKIFIKKILIKTKRFRVKPVHAKPNS